MDPVTALPKLLALAWLLPLASFTLIVFFGPRMGHAGKHAGTVLELLRIRIRHSTAPTAGGATTRAICCTAPARHCRPIGVGASAAGLLRTIDRSASC